MSLTLVHPAWVSSTTILPVSCLNTARISGWEELAASVMNSPASLNSREKGVTYSITSVPHLMLVPGMLVTIQCTYILGSSLEIPASSSMRV